LLAGVVLRVEPLDPPPHPAQPSPSSNINPLTSNFLRRPITTAPWGSSIRQGNSAANIPRDDPRCEGTILIASLVVVLIVMVIFAGKLVNAENAQLASEGKPEHANLTAEESGAFELSVSCAVPCWPATMLTGVLGPDRLSVGSVTVRATPDNGTFC